MSFNNLLIIGHKRPELEKKGFHVVETWNGDHKFHHNKANLYNLLGLRENLYGFTKHDIQKYDNFLIFETGKAHWIIDDIRKWNPSANIKFVMANIVNDYGLRKIRELQHRDIEIFSFDQGDCEKYGLKWYPALCFYEGKIDKKPTINDIYFIGKDKGRADYILQIDNFFRKKGIKTNFKIVLDKKSKYSQGNCGGVHFLEKSISYESVLQDISESNSILDIVQRGQCGLTMRPMEALFYDKKLITNNCSVSSLSFYNDKNILILRDNNLNDVVKFLCQPFQGYSESVKQQYTFENFIKKIFKEVDK